MAELLRKQEESGKDAGGARGQAAPQRQAPTESATHGMEREPDGQASLSEEIRAHTNRPHKGDVGRPETNEEVYQGSKVREM
jgi:hypothetical protein